MKPDFKINFAKRDVIAMVCFTFVMILVLILGNSFGFVSADETISIDDNYVSSGWGDSYNSDLNFTDYSNSSLYNPNVSTSHIAFSGSDFNVYDYFDALSSNMPSQIGNSNSNDFGIYNPIDPDYGSYPSYVIRYMGLNSGNYEITMWLFPSSECYYCFNKVLVSADSWDYQTLPYYRIIFRFDSSGNYVGGFSNYYYLNNPSTYNGYIYVPELASTSVYGIDICNFSMIAELSDYSGSFNNDTNITNYLNGENNYYTEINYMIADGNYSGIGTNNGGGTSENSSNNLYLNSPFWSFNMPHNNQLTSTNGTATFNAVPTDYQLEHPNQFELHYWFQIDVTYTYNDNGDGGFSGAGHGFSILNSIRPQDSLGTTVKRSRTGIFKYRYNGSDSAVVPFSDFDGSQSFQTITVGSGWNKIFRQCYLSGNTSYNTFYDWWKDYGRTTPTDNDSLPIVTDAKLKCYAQLYDSTSSSGICAYYYDFLTGESGVLDDSLGVNTNPYDFDTQDQYSNSSSGYGYVTQNNNNNQSVVINNNTGVNSDDTDSLKDQLEATLGDEQGGLIDTFKSKAQSNGWLMLMNSIFGFVPSSIWVDLATFLATCLGIFVVFLILRFLLDLL